ncbi:MAG: carboxypeptidase M32 [Rhodospirillaceae bacterium]|nr:carboxypeptidase M32 [Rhodospirillaceae bacterium]
MPSAAYRELERRFARMSGIDNALGILHWDQETQMPEGATETRGDALATLQVLHHELLTDPRVGELLDGAEAAGGLDAWQQANLREMRRGYLHATAVPADLVEASAKATTACEVAWRAARRDNDFAGLKPRLALVLSLTRQVGEAKSAALGLDLYDALLDGFEPGGRAAEIDAVFAELAAFLPAFTAEVLERQASRPAPLPLAGPFPVEMQRRLGLDLMRAAGFDFERGRLDVSAHPFCGGADNDVRITTRYDETDFTKALMGVMHETGHALYEQGRPAAWMHQPVGSSRGMAMHESQSLALEMQACRSAEFLAYAAPLMRAAFADHADTGGPAWTADNLHRLYTRVERGLIRVDADEVTYPAHVILRYRLERAMLNGDLALDDLPGAWADAMADLVGVVPPDDRRGCLQDIHWPGGAWAYFPTYTLGAMIAAQLFDAACKAEPDLLPGLTRGDFAPFVGWLRRHVHSQGSARTTTELLTAATGRPLDAGVFKAHLRRRYLDA